MEVKKRGSENFWKSLTSTSCFTCLECLYFLQSIYFLPQFVNLGLQVIFFLHKKNIQKLIDMYTVKKKKKKLNYMFKTVSKYHGLLYC